MNKEIKRSSLNVMEKTINNDFNSLAVAELSSASELGKQPRRAICVAHSGLTMDDKKEMEAKDENAHIHKAYVKLPTEILADVALKTISGPAGVLYAFLLFWQGKKYDLFYGIRAMARETGFCEGKIKDLLKELVSAGHIWRTRRFGACWHTKCLTVLENGVLYSRSKGCRLSPHQAADKVHRQQRPSAPPVVQVDQTVTKEEEDWISHRPWNECSTSRYDEIRKYFPFEQARRQFLQWEKECEEMTRRMYAES